MKRRSSSIICHVLSLALVCALCFSCLISINVKAAKRVTLPPHGYDTMVEDIEPDVATISKKGSYKVILPKNETGNFNGYLKFVVPKTKKYTFTVDKVKGKGKDFIFGEVNALRANGSGGTDLLVFKLKKGRNAFLCIATKKYSNSEKKRVGTVKLTKGTVLYIYFGLHQGTKSDQCSVNLKIK